MTTTIKVRTGSVVREIKAFRGPDGLTVADPRGARASRKLWKDVQRAAEERTKPQEYSPFRIYSRRSLA